MRKRKVLIVDDETNMRIFLATLLETNGYQPIQAADGSEGMTKAREVMPHLIILDVMMPKLGGIQMYRQLKNDEQLKDIPVIMLSAIAEKTFFHSQSMLNYYMGDSMPEPEAYIEKPPEPEELLRWTEKLLTDRE
jgi:CheY-like chemotaxis protein